MKSFLNSKKSGGTASCVMRYRDIRVTEISQQRSSPPTIFFRRRFSLPCPLFARSEKGIQPMALFFRFFGISAGTFEVQIAC